VTSQADLPGVAARVLLVDDDPEMLRGLQFSLRRSGYDTRGLSDGAEVIEAVARWRPDIVVLDVMMPRVDGWQVLTALRGREDTEDIPVLMLTAKDSLQAKVTGFTLGADDYLTKPFSVHELRCRIAALLRRGRPRRALDDERKVPVAVASGVELVPVSDVTYAEGIRNYTYVHTAEHRLLSRLSLGDMEREYGDVLIRIHRSYLVNPARVVGGRWVSHSTYKVRLADGSGTEIPVSRTRITEIQQMLGLRR
jgi:DNA-binding response OmpR family regulator